MSKSQFEHAGAIKILRDQLVRREERLLELRQGLYVPRGDKGFYSEMSHDRDQYHFVLGEVCQTRELLMCLGVNPLDIKTEVSVKLQKLDGR